MTERLSDPPATSQRQPSSDVTEVVRAAPLPALVLEVPTERIVAASPSAQTLLCGDDEDIVGHNLEEFAEDDPTGALDLLMAGRLNGYEARRILRQAPQGVLPMHVWIRRLGIEDPPEYVLAVLSETSHAPTVPPPLAHADDHLAPVVGGTDRALQIDRISTDVRDLLGYEPEDLVGRSLLSLVEPEDASSMLWALAQATTSGSGAIQPIALRHAGGGQIRCQFLVVPLVPAPSIGFALLPGDEALRTMNDRADMEQLLWRLGRGVQAVAVSRKVGESDTEQAAMLSRLSSRELEIVAMLVAGDRVPVIAERLYLAQSTVRNHLSSVFRKLRVGSQQELITLLRRRDRPPGQL